MSTGGRVCAFMDVWFHVLFGFLVGCIEQASAPAGVWVGGLVEIVVGGQLGGGVGGSPVPHGFVVMTGRQVSWRID